MSKRAILLASCLLAVSTLRCHAILYFTPAEYLGSVESSFIGAFRMQQNEAFEILTAPAQHFRVYETVDARLRYIHDSGGLSIVKPEHKYPVSGSTPHLKSLANISNHIFQGTGDRTFESGDKTVAMRIRRTPSMEKISMLEWPFGKTRSAPALRSTLRFDKTADTVSSIWFEQKMSRSRVFTNKPIFIRDAGPIIIVKRTPPFVEKVSLNVYERLAPAGKSSVILEAGSFVIALKPGFSPLAQQARLAAMKMAFWLPRLAR